MAKKLKREIGTTKSRFPRHGDSAISPAKMTDGGQRFNKERQEISNAIGEISSVQQRLKPILRRAWPAGSDKDISWLACDLAGLWKVSRIHMVTVKRLLAMNDHPTRDELLDVLINLEINWLQDATGHIQTLKRELRRVRV